MEKLRVDHVDLLQLHHLVEEEDWEVAMGPGGALEWAVEARDRGLVGYIGVTGHGLAAPEMHLRSLERFDFDSVLLPYNYLLMRDFEYATGFEALMRVCRERGVAVQTIKSIARGPWGNKTRIRTVWYEPLESPSGIDRAVHWVLARPEVFLNTAGDMSLLPKVLDAAARFQSAPTESEMRRLVAEERIVPLFT
jgi:predicted aldo/keto reductase-like oxidoreductase